ncbi:hypothetical protein [Okeania sp. SIO1F9]|uniref:hypothetical protein n=1 Tax=Okeania sp. SIO1F9 TaxID=2607813 RepID=UPI00144F71A9|nr:hypothetical protein [Okeania sp. SIO1F9]NET76540.1 hypothetical protein [Okeania sp. SIO1F9]
MKKKLIILLKNISLIYVGLFLLSLIFAFSIPLPYFDFGEVVDLQKGCYRTNDDFIVDHIECRGLPINGLVKFFLNFWMRLVVSAALAFHLTEAAYSTLLYWSPLFYLLWYAIKGRHLTK